MSNPTTKPDVPEAVVTPTDEQLRDVSGGGALQ